MSMSTVSDENVAEQARKAAIKKILEDLDWRGPTGRKAGHVVLPRSLAAALIGYEDK